MTARLAERQTGGGKENEKDRQVEELEDTDGAQAGRQTGSSETGTVQQRSVAPSSRLTSSRSDRSADESDQMIDNQSDINKMMMMMMMMMMTVLLL